MSTRLCAITDCGNVRLARGFCAKHYQRWLVHGDPLTVKFKKAADGEPRKFLEALPLEGDGCVLWPYSKNNVGYGQINLRNGKKALAHRISCERKNGSPPTDKHRAAHSCGKGHLGCVAPWHLSWKTDKENSADMDIHGTRSCGERHHAKLTEAKVREILALAGSLSQAQIAEQYGVSQTLISKLIRGGGWQHLPETKFARPAAGRGPGSHGADNNNSRITEQQVREIRASAEKFKDIAARYNITKENVSLIKRRRTWRNVSP